MLFNLKDRAKITNYLPNFHVKCEKNEKNLFSQAFFIFNAHDLFK
jgi:hypothetical protein